MQLTLLAKLIIVFIFVVLLGIALGTFVLIQRGLENRVAVLEVKEASRSAIIIPTVEPTVTASPSAAPTVFLKKAIKPVPVITQ